MGGVDLGLNRVDLDSALALTAASRLPSGLASDAPPRLHSSRSEITAEGKRITKLEQILLNGNNVALLIPGGSPNYET